MTTGQLLDIFREFFLLAVRIGGPILLGSMLLGVVIAIFQAATQIHEQTVTFVPKLAAISLFLLFQGGNMLETLQDFTKKRNGGCCGYYGYAVALFHNRAIQWFCIPKSSFGKEELSGYGKKCSGTGFEYICIPVS